MKISDIQYYVLNALTVELIRPHLFNDISHDPRFKAGQKLKFFGKHNLSFFYKSAKFKFYVQRNLPMHRSWCSSIDLLHHVRKYPLIVQGLLCTLLGRGEVVPGVEVHKSSIEGNLFPPLGFQWFDWEKRKYPLPLITSEQPLINYLFSLQK